MHNLGRRTTEVSITVESAQEIDAVLHGSIAQVDLDPKALGLENWAVIDETDERPEEQKCQCIMIEEVSDGLVPI